MRISIPRPAIAAPNRRWFRPDYSEAAKFGDIWLNAKQGTDAALAMAMGHVILREFHLNRQVEYFDDYTRHYTDLPTAGAAGRERRPAWFRASMLRAADFDGTLGPSQQSRIGKPSVLTRPAARSWFRMARSVSAGAKPANGILRKRPMAPPTRLKTTLMLDGDQ
ncbi:MAG: hypothetical protein V9G14_12990 [Cypionkella sp.]